MSVALQLQDQLVAWRRDFHQFAEPGWTEFRTTSAIITVLRDLGWDTVYGPELHDADARLGVPGADVLGAERERAVSQGADPELVEAKGAAQTRNEVKASMMGRDVILAPVILPEAAASGPAQSGPTEQFGASEAPHASVSGATHRWAQPRRVRLGAASSPRLGSPARDTGESLTRSRTS